MTALSNPAVSKLEVIYEDAWLRVLNKPSGLSVLRDNTGLPSLMEVYEDLFKEKPAIVHRLDKGASGLLVAARSNEARAALQRAFAKRIVEKRYLALVEGVPGRPEGVIDLPLEKARKGKRRIAATGCGWPAETHYLTLGSKNNQSLLLCRPTTGRTHQIRLHLQAIGRPLVKDPLYGLQRSRPSMHPELTLHSWGLSFPHPKSGEIQRFQTQVPEWCRAFGIQTGPFSR